MILRVEMHFAAASVGRLQCVTAHHSDLEHLCTTEPDNKQEGRLSPIWIARTHPTHSPTNPPTHALTALRAH